MSDRLFFALWPDSALRRALHDRIEDITAIAERFGRDPGMLYFPAREVRRLLADSEGQALNPKGLAKGTPEDRTRLSGLHRRHRKPLANIGLRYIDPIHRLRPPLPGQPGGPRSRVAVAPVTG